MILVHDSGSNLILWSTSIDWESAKAIKSSQFALSPSKLRRRGLPPPQETAYLIHHLSPSERICQ
jgi:hypothetical protein